MKIVLVLVALLISGCASNPSNLNNLYNLSLIRFSLPQAKVFEHNFRSSLSFTTLRLISREQSSRKYSLDTKSDLTEINDVITETLSEMNIEDRFIRVDLSHDDLIVEYLK